MMKNEKLSVEDLRRFVKVADRVDKRPYPAGEDLIEAAGEARGNGNWTKFRARFARWIPEPIFREEMLIGTEVLWDDVEPFERSRARKSFPKAKI